MFVHAALQSKRLTPSTALLPRDLPLDWGPQGGEPRVCDEKMLDPTVTASKEEDL